jgi:hypothetical protein
MYSHGQDPLGVLLPDDIIIQDVANLTRARNALFRLETRSLALFTDDIHAKLDAFVADEHGWTRNQLLYFVLALSTEGAVERILGIAGAVLFGHGYLNACDQLTHDLCRAGFSHENDLIF